LTDWLAKASRKSPFVITIPTGNRLGTQSRDHAMNAAICLQQHISIKHAHQGRITQPDEWKKQVTPWAIESVSL
jgi:hypothetical protein